jgi:hypothetical protein
LRVLDEAECYARCYGDYPGTVEVIAVVPARPRMESRLSGEDIRHLFDLRLDARDAELQSNVDAA